VSGVVIVGSYARGDPTPGSDVDLVIIAETPNSLLVDRAWLQSFGKEVDGSPEDWGKVQSLRADLGDGLEVEFGIAGDDWLEQPIDDGTAAVLRNGVAVLFDRGSYLRAALAEFDAPLFEGAIISDA